MENKNFKYKKEHALLSCDCPPKALLSPINMISYRWVNEDIDHAHNFIPPLLIEPSRIENFQTCELKCENYALSLFNDQYKAEKKLKEFLQRKPCLAEVFGSAIAKGEIVENDGLADTPRPSGHFNFHEYEDTDLKRKFVIIKKIEIEK
jgi:hypothetical protein